MSARPELHVLRCQSLTLEARMLLEEYYDAAEVVVRDGPEAMEALLTDPRSGMWVAWQDGAPAGCVVLRAGVPVADAAECKRLYVRPAFRGKGVAAALMQALESFAAETGFTWIYLDTRPNFAASVGLYRSRGYEECARYNQNPQAMMFFRKRLGHGG